MVAVVLTAAAVVASAVVWLICSTLRWIAAFNLLCRLWRRICRGRPPVCGVASRSPEGSSSSMSVITAITTRQSPTIVTIPAYNISITTPLNNNINNNRSTLSCNNSTPCIRRMYIVPRFTTYTTLDLIRPS